MPTLVLGPFRTFSLPPLNSAGPNESRFLNYVVAATHSVGRVRSLLGQISFREARAGGALAMQLSAGARWPMHEVVIFGQDETVCLSIHELVLDALLL